MRKFVICLGIFILSSTAAFAAKIPDNDQQFISNDFPKTNFRFDGVIILPTTLFIFHCFPQRF